MGGRYLKEILILNSFSFEDKDPRFTRLKPVLALRLLSKELFYVRVMTYTEYVSKAVAGIAKAYSGGFHLYLSELAFINQFYSIMTRLVRLSLAND